MALSTKSKKIEDCKYRSVGIKANTNRILLTMGGKPHQQWFWSLPLKVRGDVHISIGSKVYNSSGT
jgi:hypothetical protein